MRKLPRILDSGLPLTWQQILSISIYKQSSDSPKVSFGKRATLYPGTAPLHQILAEEAVGAYLIQYEPADVDWDAKTPVGSNYQPGNPVKDGELELGRAGTRQRNGKMLVTGRKFCPL